MTTGEDHQFNIKESPLSTFTFPRGTFQIVTMVTMVPQDCTLGVWR